MIESAAVDENIASHDQIIPDWRKIGTQVPVGCEPGTFLELAQLDWEVQKVQPYYVHGEDLIATRDMALVRNSEGKYPKLDGIELSRVSDGWEPVQNSEAFNFVWEFIQKGNMKMDTIGSLQDGRIIWALAKMGESFQIFGEDLIESYLLFTNPHQYGKTIDIRFIPMRIRNWSALTLQLSNKGDLSVKSNHRRKFDPALVEKALGTAKTKLEEYRRMAELLGSKPADKVFVMEYFKKVFPINSRANPNEISKMALTAFKELETQPGAEIAFGTWWQAYNAAIFVVDHRGTDNIENRLYSAWYGENRGKKSAALKLAWDYATGMHLL